MADILVPSDSAALNAQNQLTNEPTGMPTDSRNNTTISFDDGTRTFTISPVSGTFDYYIRGVKFTSAGASVVVPDVTALYLIMFDNTGTLVYQVGFDVSVLNNNAFIASVYWNATTNSHYNFLTDERHGLTMDWATHAHLHNSFGTRYYSGFNIGFTLGDGSLDAHAEIALQGGVISDEDLRTTVVDDATPTNYFEQELSPIAQVPVVYLLGSEWTNGGTTNVPLITAGSGRMAYNNAGAITEATDTYHVAMWVFAVPYTNEPVIAIMGTREDALLADAKANNVYDTIDWSGLPSQEYKILYRLIFQTDDTYANTYKTRLVEVLDLRAELDGNLGIETVTPATAHGSLTGLGNDDHTQYHNDARGDLRYLQLSEYVDANTGIILATQLPQIDIEDFVNTNAGTKIPMTASNASGGSLSGAILQALYTDWNQVSPSKIRSGLIFLSISTVSASRSALSTNNSYRMIYNAENSIIHFGAEVAFTNSSVDFVNDPVFIGWGLLTSFAAYPTTASGIYFRPPRVGETAFLKACVMQAGVETIFDTTIVYDATNNRMVKTNIVYDPLVDEIRFTAQANGVTSTVILTTVGVTYASLVPLNYAMGALVARNGLPAVGVTRSLIIDKFIRITSNNYTI